MKKIFAVILACASLSACATNGDSADASTSAVDTDAFQAPIDYIPTALGPHSWKITTSSDMAQRYFDQGLPMR